MRRSTNPKRQRGACRGSSLTLRVRVVRQSLHPTSAIPLGARTCSEKPPRGATCHTPRRPSSMASPTLHDEEVPYPPLSLSEEKSCVATGSRLVKHLGGADE